MAGIENYGDPAGIFMTSPVAGLTYRTTFQKQAVTLETTKAGGFYCDADETITFSIGSLVLGSAAGKSVVTPLDLVPGAAGTGDRRVANMLALIQTLDEDGNLNNGIQISRAISDVVSRHADAINFDQEPRAFASDDRVKALLAALNSAKVFNGPDPRPRKLRRANKALEHFARSMRERKIVETQYGAVNGYAANDKTWQWLGVPYAKPPLGDLRWKPPVEPDPWQGVRDAVAWSDQAAQSPFFERFGEGGMSEDCLYLNITAPKDAANLPVMVWFHGGFVTITTGNTKPFNNPNSLTAKGVVLVTVNHRLGAFGYCAHPLLSRESGYNGSGNYGQMDLIAALQWIKNNIARFGGNPDNVTLFGQSGGGRKILSLMASPLAAGLFHKAISQSGSLIPDTRSLADAEAIGEALFKNLNAATPDELRSKSWVDIVDATSKFGPTSKLTPYMNVDGYYLPHTERVSFETGRHNDVPLMILATTNDEPYPITTVRDVLPWMSDHTSQKYYACVFSKVPSGWEAQGIPAYHCDELTYVFNDPTSVVDHHVLQTVIDPATGKSLVIGDLNGNGIAGSAGDAADIMASAGWSAEDAAAAETAMTVWTNFAKTGNPGVGAFTWPPYTRANDTYVEFGKTLEVRTGLANAFPLAAK
ncbi:MAG: carboxylesterase family protein [Deltaproteobacteria bacterium]|nr:carboxylesterase family protein [Deltaproteobacteria bacterium]